jgi:hypothetical protein
MSVALAKKNCFKMSVAFRKHILMIREADELDEIFANEGDDHKVEIPNLKYLVFENLPSLYHAQGIQFQAVKYRFIQNCQKLSLASAITAYLENDLSSLYSNIFGTHSIQYFF